MKMIMKDKPQLNEGYTISKYKDDIQHTNSSIYVLSQVKNLYGGMKRRVR